jgi:chromosome segregation ATPase
MSLSNHFKRSPSFEYADLSWLSPVPIAVEGEVKIKVSKTQPTEPTELPPSKGVLTYVKNARFNAYKSTRPALLTEINLLVDSGLQRIEREFGENVPEHLVLDVYSKGFERYINESSLYQPFLRRTKDEYDRTILRQLNKLATYVDFDKQLQHKDAQHSNQLSETVNELQLQIKELESKCKELQSNEIILNTTLKNLASENTRLQDANALLKSEVEASKGTCNSLSTSLARLVDDKNKSDILESTMMVNLSHCKQVENSLNLEIDK